VGTSTETVLANAAALEAIGAALIENQRAIQESSRGIEENTRKLLEATMRNVAAIEASTAAIDASAIPDLSQVTGGRILAAAAGALALLFGATCLGSWAGGRLASGARPRTDAS